MWLFCFLLFFFFESCLFLRERRFESEFERGCEGREEGGEDARNEI